MKMVYLLALGIAVFSGMILLMFDGSLADDGRATGYARTGYLCPEEDGFYTHHNSGGARATESPYQRVGMRYPRSNSLVSAKNLNMP
jgi:hypothetical protein